MELKLNVYNDYDEIVKTYKKDSYLIKMGFLKKFIKTIDIEKLSKTLSAVNSFDNNIILMKMGTSIVTESYEIIQDLMKQVFKGLTEEEYENVPVKDIAKVLIDLIKYTVETISVLGVDEKN